jgi:hypothetical protein
MATTGGRSPGSWGLPISTSDLLAELAVLRDGVIFHGTPLSNIIVSGEHCCGRGIRLIDLALVTSPSSILM